MACRKVRMTVYRCRAIRRHKVALAVSGVTMTAILLFQIYSTQHMVVNEIIASGDNHKEDKETDPLDPDIAFLKRQNKKPENWNAAGMYDVREKMPYVKPPNHYRNNITINSVGRFGNIMFEYASLLGIASTVKMKPYLSDALYLKEFFHIDTPTLDSDPSVHWTDFSETTATAFDPGTQYLYEAETNIRLNGYFQSWKYFQHIAQEIRHQFQFKDIILKHASRYLRRAFQRHFGTNITRDSVTVIGVHIRRSDMLNYDNILAGYTVASKEYIKASLTYFEASYPTRPLLFLVCTDDPEWSSRHVVPSRSPVVVSEGNHALVDLALLTMCDHSIITVGTFGWWSAWLAGGKTLYYKDFPTPDSTLARDFSHEDFYPPNWIGI